jgi:hypothetical protein
MGLTIRVTINPDDITAEAWAAITLDPESALLFAERCQGMNAANGAVLVHLIQSINDYIPRIALARLTQYGPDPS